MRRGTAVLTLIGARQIDDVVEGSDAVNRRKQSFTENVIDVVDGGGRLATTIFLAAGGLSSGFAHSEGVL